VTLEVDAVSVTLGGRVVLAGVTARVRHGGFLGVIGPNGAGKSTLLRAVAGLVPYAGEVRVAGQRRDLASRRRAARLVAYVPQRPVLPPGMTVTDYVLLGRAPHRPYLGGETRRDRLVAAAVLERLGLAGLAGRTLGEVSGGEAQRAVLARALAQEAPVLVLDEPTASLDLGHGQRVLELADELRRERSLSVLCAIHDLTLAAQYADELLVLAGGRAVAAGTADEVLTEANVGRFFAASVEVLPARSGRAVVPARPKDLEVPGPVAAEAGGA